ncbi:MAG: PVC-type heme-binding CxxCH protein [Cyclobacteriaceae bacterium]
MTATAYQKNLFFALFSIATAIALIVGASSCSSSDSLGLEVDPGSHIILVGNNLASRMENFGHFETELHLRYPDHQLYIRNMADPGNTPGFRPHPSRVSPWAFPGAEKFQDELAHDSNSKGVYPTPDDWLTSLEADIILAFFGYNESFQGEAGLENFRAELEAFIDHTLSQNYNGDSTRALQLAIVSPIAFEDLSDQYDLPDGKQENQNLELYTRAMREVAAENSVHFVDVFQPTQQWFGNSEEPLTIDGFQLTDAGYRQFADLLADKTFGEKELEVEEYRNLVHDAVMEKNWMWLNDYKIPNGVHVYGRRYEPFGPDNYPFEIEKIREMTAIRDEAIWQATQGDRMNIVAADAQTSELPPVESNFATEEGSGSQEYLYGQDALDKFTMAPGYKIEMFASEQEFEDLANPVQLSFDNQGRLWVATMPSYPHYKPGDAKPNDKIIILEDTDGDGKADKQTTFADSLHLPVGFEIAPEGVYISQRTDLILFKDTDGDDQADTYEILLSGFDDHDTHHMHSAYTGDPSGAIYMGEGVFLHTNVETPYGPVRATNGGFYRYSPQRRRLERVAQLPIPNPWGIAFDEWGQDFYADTSGPDVQWMMPGEVNPRYGVSTTESRNLIEDAHRVRPTSGLEFVSTRHFPEVGQGDLLINNTIGFLGTKQHSMVDDGTGYRSRHRQDLVQSSDPNFRPVDMEFAPDGSLYIVDWHNMLVGHMQHNARDPYRDHVHGRIYRVTYPSRPLVEPAEIAGASIEQLLENLKLPEYRTRYRTRRELRGRNSPELSSKLENWVETLDENDPRYEHHLLEGLWVSWGLNQVNQDLLRRLLQSEDHRVRAAATRVLRYTGHQVKDQADLLMQMAQDEHGRVRLEAIVAASWLDREQGLPIVEAAGEKPIDDWMQATYETALAHLNGRSVQEQKDEAISTQLTGAERELFVQGKEIYSEEGYCGTCHQSDGGGLSASQFPPLAGTKWVLGSEERLIKLTLKGLMGPITVLDREYPGQVPMTQFGGLLNDEEIAAVLTYVRNSFGNQASAISPEKVKEVRAAIADKTGFYSPEELLKEHPLEN